MKWVTKNLLTSNTEVTNMKTITSISGGKTSAYLAKHYPTDEKYICIGKD